MSTAVRARFAAWRSPALALRARDWWYFAPLPLAGAVSSAFVGPRAASHAIGAVVAASACLGFAYGLNGITDRGLDRDPRKNALAGSPTIPSEAVYLLALCGAVALGSCMMLGARPWAVVASLVAGATYSAGPRLKRLPLVGTLTNLAIFVPLPYFAVDAPGTVEHQLLAATFAGVLTQSQLLHELADADEDAAAGVRTTAVAVGAVGRAFLALALGPVLAVALHRLAGGGAAGAAAAAVVLGGSGFLVASATSNAARRRIAHRGYSLVAGAALFGLLLREARS